MAAIRRPPKPPAKPIVKRLAPIHQRILGKSQVELDILDDLEIELEKALGLDLIEYDSYLECCDALELRRIKAREGLDKATGRYVKPEKRVDINVRRVRHYRPKRLKIWQRKLLIVAGLIIFFKLFC